jgi:hypothetical protein
MLKKIDQSLGDPHLPIKPSYRIVKDHPASACRIHCRKNSDVGEQPTFGFPDPFFRARKASLHGYAKAVAFRCWTHYRFSDPCGLNSVLQPDAKLHGHFPARIFRQFLPLKSLSAQIRCAFTVPVCFLD